MYFLQERHGCACAFACILLPQKNGGAGFYRFLAWARTKPNDVSPGHAIYVE
jgi:hypothetical protein